MKRKLLGGILFALYGFVVFVLPIIIHFILNKWIGTLGDQVLHISVCILTLILQAAIVSRITRKKDNLFHKIIEKFFRD